MKEDPLPKLFSQIVLSEAKENLYKNMTKFQIATKPGHRASEHLFVALSLMSFWEKTGVAIIISMFDIKKYFDSESALDCWSELYNSQVKGKVYRLLFNLNKTSRIKVKTSVGVSQSAVTGPLVTQGSVEGAVLSAVNLDNGIREFFHNEEEKDDNNDKKKDKEAEKDDKVIPNTDDKKDDEDVKYGNIKLQPLLFQDDIWNASKSRDAAQRTNEKMEMLMESKLLDLHLDKSCYIVAGEKKAREKIKKQLNSKPLLLYRKNMKEAVNNKYLGVILSSTVAQSVADTVTRRVGVARRTVYEIKIIVEDSQAGVRGSFLVRLNLWSSL